MATPQVKSADVPTSFKLETDVTYSKGALALLLGVTERAIEKWAKARRGTFPRPFYIGRTPYWRGHVIIAWMEREQQEAARPR